MLDTETRQFGHYEKLHVKYRLPFRGRYDGLQYRLLLKSASSLPTGRQAETETMLDNKSKAR